VLACVAIAAACPNALWSQPSVSIANPPANAAFSTGNTIVLSASAAPSAGASISYVQYYLGSSLLGQSNALPYAFSWSNAPTGTFSIQAIATDSLGNSSQSPVQSLSIAGIDLPYVTDFEPSEGYVPGSLNGQLGWSVIQGSAAIVSGQAYSGSQSVVLTPTNPPALIAQALQPSTNPAVVYVDLGFQPVAEVNVMSSSIVTAGGASFGFLASGGVAQVETLNGDGQGGGAWVPTATGASVALTSGTNQASGWHRFTIREDFTNQIWDLYVDGAMVAYNLNFSNAVSSVNSLVILGSASLAVGLDTVYVGATNPLFTNQSNDGIADSWKQQFGLDPTQDERNLSPNGNGALVIQDFVQDANPLDYFSGRATQISSPTPSNQVSYSYDASGRLVSAQVGGQSAETYTFDNAANLTNATTVAQPIVAWRSTNDLPPDGSGIGDDSASPAGDSVPNLVKYALGLPALQAVVGPVPIIALEPLNGSSYLTLQYSRPDPAPADLTYTVQVSSDAQNWSSGSGVTTQLSSTSSNGVATVVYADLTPVGQPQYGRYIRLLITRTPVQQ
jgi:YD repeat-containing protein